MPPELARVATEGGAVPEDAAATLVQPAQLLSVRAAARQASTTGDRREIGTFITPSSTQM
jgi:hypothetical protein